MKSLNGTAPILQEGCYFVRYTPEFEDPSILFYEGTIRVLHLPAEDAKDQELELRAGGDLYSRWRNFPFGRSIKPEKEKLPDPLLYRNPNGDIPIFARVDYKYHLEFIDLLESSTDGFTARFKVHEYSRDSEWPNPGSRLVIAQKGEPPADWVFPKPPGQNKPLFYSGKVVDESNGRTIGTLTVGWISEKLRRVHILVDRLEDLAPPCDLKHWKEAFPHFQVDVTNRTVMVNPPPKNPKAEAQKKTWKVSELHNLMLKAKALFDKSPSSTEIKLDLAAPVPPVPSTSSDPLDQEWLYHLFCVEKIEGFDRGVMYDTYGTDSNNVPREGAAVSCSWRFEPETEWGYSSGKLLSDEAEVFRRVAVHEVGHAMGLDHNFQDLGYMCTTDAIAGAARKLEEEVIAATDRWVLEDRFATVSKRLLKDAKAGGPGKPKLNLRAINHLAKRTTNAYSQAVAAMRAAADEKAQFPNNVRHSFHPDDLSRLWFGPDVTIRPGGEFDDGGPYFARRDRAVEGFRLEVKPLLRSVPLGAPVRVNVKLTNTSSGRRPAPENLGLSGGHVEGFVNPPNGDRRTFWPLKKCVDEDRVRYLQPQESCHSGLTLLRGAQGALFPMPGFHTIYVKVSWEEGDARVSAIASCVVEITPPTDPTHNALAQRILTTPDVLLSLVIGGDHLTEGNSAIEAASKDKTLAPHFAVFDIKKQAFQNQVHAVLLDAKYILSQAEKQRILELLGLPIDGDFESLIRSHAQKTPSSTGYLDSLAVP